VSGPVKTVLLGPADPRQAREVGRFGLDGAVLVVGGDEPYALDVEAAAEVAAALPPLAARIVWRRAGAPRPTFAAGAVARQGETFPAGAAPRVRLLPPGGPDPDARYVPGELLWIPPRPGATILEAYDLAALGRLARVAPLMIEAPGGAADVGPLLHAVRPAALLFGEAVRAAGRFIDVDALEEGLAAVARANAAAFSAPL